MGDFLNALDYSLGFSGCGGCEVEPNGHGSCVKRSICCYSDNFTKGRNKHGWTRDEYLE